MSKAKSSIRTEPRQVIPDTTLWRRTQAPVARGTPVAEATTTAPLVGRKSVFDGLGITYVFDEKSGKGVLQFSEPLWTVNRQGGPYPKGENGVSRYVLFSKTSKMSAPSFSLPAGPPREGGTCVAADKFANQLVRPARGTSPGGSRVDKKGNAFVCDLCYAVAGNYWNTVVPTAQTARMVWCRRLLAEDPSGKALGQAIVTAIEDLARRGHYGNLTKRLGLELGVWHNGRLVAPGRVEGRRGLIPIDLPPTVLPAWTGFSSSTEFFASKGVPEGSVSGFFRIHDSGDLNLDKKMVSWEGYLNAWVHVAELLPWVWFWIPVRTWTSKPMIPALQRANALPNMVVRASALYVDGDVPQIPGLATSGVHRENLREGWYPCPVTPDDGSSCAQENCRACWISPEKITSYFEH